jgi:hypothetical protein
MTSNDFFLLFVAFGGFLVAPALLLWGFSCLTRRKSDHTRGPDIRPDSPDAPRNSRREESEQSEGATHSRRGAVESFEFFARCRWREEAAQRCS